MCRACDEESDLEVGNLVQGTLDFDRIGEIYHDIANLDRWESSSKPLRVLCQRISRTIHEDEIRSRPTRGAPRRLRRDPMAAPVTRPHGPYFRAKALPFTVPPRSGIFTSFFVSNQPTKAGWNSMFLTSGAPAGDTGPMTTSKAPTTPAVPLDARATEGLAAAFRGEVIFPEDKTYDEHRKVWNGSIDRHPALIARCAGVADVVQAVRFARTHALRVAVRSGGHSYPGHSVCDGGIVIDLRSHERHPGRPRGSDGPRPGGHPVG